MSKSWTKYIFLLRLRYFLAHHLSLILADFLLIITCFSGFTLKTMKTPIPSSSGHDPFSFAERIEVDLRTEQLKSLQIDYLSAAPGNLLQEEDIAYLERSDGSKLQLIIDSYHLFAARYPTTGYELSDNEALLVLDPTTEVFPEDIVKSRLFDNLTIANILYVPGTAATLLVNRDFFARNYLYRAVERALGNLVSSEAPLLFSSELNPGEICLPSTDSTYDFWLGEIKYSLKIQACDEALIINPLTFIEQPIGTSSLVFKNYNQLSQVLNKLQSTGLSYRIFYDLSAMRTKIEIPSYLILLAAFIVIVTTIFLSLIMVKFSEERKVFQNNKISRRIILRTESIFLLLNLLIEILFILIVGSTFTVSLGLGTLYASIPLEFYLSVVSVLLISNWLRIIYRGVVYEN